MKNSLLNQAKNNNKKIKTYDPELFGKALPCLTAIGCALSPDYSYAFDSNDAYNNQYEENEAFFVRKQNSFEPVPLITSSVILASDFEEIIRSFSEHVHDYWCFNKVIYDSKKK